ncbi:unnamed protein product [Amoebophrya sp. A120]|nr:unnamed protein product [Amoebophrya sp. A120]|eukprot:GSA120T00012627001.1
MARDGGKRGTTPTGSNRRPVKTASEASLPEITGANAKSPAGSFKGSAYYCHHKPKYPLVTISICGAFAALFTAISTQVLPTLFTVDVLLLHASCWAFVYVTVQKSILILVLPDGSDYNEPMFRKPGNTPRWSFWVCAVRSLIFCVALTLAFLIVLAIEIAETAAKQASTTRRADGLTANLNAAKLILNDVNTVWPRVKRDTLANYSSVCGNAGSGGTDTVSSWTWFEQVCDSGDEPRSSASEAFSVTDLLQRKFSSHYPPARSSTSGANFFFTGGAASASEPHLSLLTGKWCLMGLTSFMGMMLSDIWTYYKVPSLNTNVTLLAHHLVCFLSLLVAVWCNARGQIPLVFLLVTAEVGTCIYSWAGMFTENKRLVAAYKYLMTLSNIFMLLSWFWFAYCNGPHPPVFNVTFFTIAVIALAHGRQDFMVQSLKEWRKDNEARRDKEKKGK